MGKSIAAFLGAVCLVALSARVSGQTETVTGTVVDLACYILNKANTGLDHPRPGKGSQTGGEAACALACIKWDGQPVGLITRDGKMYQIAGALVAGNNIKLVPHLGHTVTITGEVTVVDGMPMLAASDLKMVSSSSR